MLARHPVTGKEIRVIQGNASLWKDKKTLVWGRKERVWTSIGSEQFEDGSWPAFFLLREAVDASRLRTIASSVKLLFVGRAVVESFGQEAFQQLHLQNIMLLEEFPGMFPHIGPVWDGSVEDAVVIIAALLRFRFVAGVELQGAAATRASFCGVKEERASPPRLWWVTQYYAPPTARRRREIENCLKFNMRSSLIDHIVLLNEKKETLPDTEGKGKLEEHVIGRRLTYKDVLEVISGFPDDVIVAFANADIAIDDETWTDLWAIDMTDKFLALLRYDVPESGLREEAQLFGPRADSQDTWVIRAADVKKRVATAKGWQDFAFPFGKNGCDNAVALEMFRKKFLVVNPAHSMRTWHYHASGVRNYKPTDVIEKPIFLYVHPSGFHDLEPIMESLPKVLRVKNAFVSPEGLVLDGSKMYIGASKQAQQRWSRAKIHGLMPAMECKRLVTAPWPAGAETDRETYVLEYLSRVIPLLLEANKANTDSAPWSFVCAESKKHLEALEVFSFGERQLPSLVRWEPDVQVWARELIATGVRESEEVTEEDVRALRSALRGWQKDFAVVGGRLRLVLVEDEDQIGGKWSRELEDILAQAWDVRVIYAGRSSVERIVESLSGAWGVVCGSSRAAMSWNWVMPEDARVFVVGGAAAAGKPMPTLKQFNCTQATVLEKIATEHGIWTGMSAQQQHLSPDAPTIFMPRADLEGYFAHAGDSFREMARMWAKRGLVRLREHPIATMCWWGEVGEKGVLLYDRPNHDWRLSAPMIEKEWRFGLFGNPKPPMAQADKARSWFFWPRRPELVEQLVEEGRSVTTWEERLRGPVFYGKTENKVQEKRRTQADWSQACQYKEGGEWVMVKGEEKYPFTQREYLEKLATARFGLCLAGYGLKCHREVECMAMGCVPLVAPECDMDSYAEPPIEGVHYVRVKTPEEAREVAVKMSKEDWEAMSAAGRAWWERNASCEGSFRLTERLVREAEASA